MRTSRRNSTALAALAAALTAWSAGSYALTVATPSGGAPPGAVATGVTNGFNPNPLGDPTGPQICV